MNSIDKRQRNQILRSEEGSYVYVRRDQKTKINQKSRHVTKTYTQKSMDHTFSGIRLRGQQLSGQTVELSVLASIDYHVHQRQQILSILSPYLVDYIKRNNKAAKQSTLLSKYQEIDVFELMGYRYEGQSMSTRFFGMVETHDESPRIIPCGISQHNRASERT